MSKLKTEADARKMLGRIVGKTGLMSFARDIGVSHTLVSLSLTGKRSISPSVARAIGLRKTTAYERVDE